MMDELSRLWQELFNRPTGPMAFRFYLQPFMAVVYAIMGGLKDAREHQPPYFWDLFTQPSHRAELVRDGWKSIRNVFLLALGMDVVYQIIVLKGLRPVEGLIVAIVLALVPYVLVRGVVNRVARMFNREPHRS